MNLNKYEAINEHRKMWAWILEKVKRRFHYRDYDFNINQLKKIYMEQTYPNDEVRNKCFMCDYVYNKYDALRCDKCLLHWNGSSSSPDTCLNNSKSPYYNLLLVYKEELRTSPYLRYQVLKWIKEMINLPVREDDKND